MPQTDWFFLKPHSGYYVEMADNGTCAELKLVGSTKVVVNLNCMVEITDRVERYKIHSGGKKKIARL